MAISAEQQNDVIALIVGMFDAAPTAALMQEFADAINGGATVASLADSFAGSDEFKSLYPEWLTDTQFATNFTTNLVGDYVSATDLAAAITAVEGLLVGNSRGATANIAVDYLMGTTVDPVYATAVTALQNKNTVATYFATNQLDASSDLASLQAVLANVDETATSVTNQMILIDANLDSLAQTLTTGQDNVTGSAGNDGFTAWIFDNQNTAQSGDMIDGGAGTDTLLAEIGDSQNFAISLKTDSVEVAQFRVQSGFGEDADNDIQDGVGTDSVVGAVQIDAQDMNGTTAFWGVDQRADLVIEDIQAGSDDVTIGWRNSDSGNVDMEVYFDNITAPGATTSGSQLFLELMDLEGMENNTAPLEDNPYVGVSFTMDGVTFQVPDDTTGITPVAGLTATYQDLVDGINGLLAAQGLTTVTASLGSSFTAIHSISGLSYDGTQVVLTNTGSETLGTGGWVAAGALPGTSNLHTVQSTTAPVTSSVLTQTDVIFDYVGSGSKGGHFIAGEISQSAAGATGSGTPGIQQFDVLVQRDSWLDMLASTNNGLEVVNAENDTGFTGDLRIDQLDDVKTFNGGSMAGDVTLTSNLMETSIAKYLDLTDTASNPDSDDESFATTGGAGNDTLNVGVDEALAGHEDFELDVSGGAGDDTITVQVTTTGAFDGTVALAGLDATTGEWYANQAAAQNVNVLNVLGGAGNDTLTVQGGGDYLIEGGSGNDDIFVDNTGAKATWALGGLGGDESTYDAGATPTERAVDITSSVTVSGVLHETQLTINFNGFEETVDVATSSADNYVGTQLTLNNAVKDAIDSSAVLSAWLSYEDGPGNVLLINSLVDDVIGETVAPTFTLVGQGSAGGGDYNAADVAALSTTVKNSIIAGDAGLTSASADGVIATALNTAIDLFEGGVGDHLTDVDVTALVGVASTFDNDSTVHADAGTNNIVLSSDLTSNNTVVFDTAFTKTSIISFHAVSADAQADVLDFTAYLTNTASASTSALSAVRVATTLNAAGAAEVNSVTIDSAAAFTVTDTFAGLTATNLLAAINGTTAYAGIAAVNGDVNAGGTLAFGTNGEAVLLVENDGNVGEFKAFQVTWDDDSATNAAGDIAAATLLGTIDFGASDITAVGFTAVSLA